ncbi:MAG: hypothetical protein EPN20_01640 [Magnetospirillum sp.]|nr:MAG: hypothetical protein EPN20_01640 [Magnetospirillum sp.]
MVAKLAGLYRAKFDQHVNVDQLEWCLVVEAKPVHARQRIQLAGRNGGNAIGWQVIDFELPQPWAEAAPDSP